MTGIPGPAIGSRPGNPGDLTPGPYDPTVSTATLLAHQGGWDEIFFVAAPLVVFAGLLIVAKRRAEDLDRPEDLGRPTDEP